MGFGCGFCTCVGLAVWYGLLCWVVIARRFWYADVGGCWFIDFLARRSCGDSSFAAFTAVKFCGLACLMLCVAVCFGF